MVAVHVAQINIGTMIAPTDDPSVAEFMDSLDTINSLADEAPGFVWRLQTEAGNATDIQIFPNPLELLNMSVWESAEALRDYVYRTEHVDYLRRRSEWFEADAKRVALWHVEAGSVPGLREAVHRVEFLERHGPSHDAFGFGRTPAPLTFEIGERAIIASCSGRIVGRVEPVTPEPRFEIFDDTIPLLTEALHDQRELARSGAI